MLACWYNQAHVVSYLLTSSLPLSDDRRRPTPFHVAVSIYTPQRSTTINQRLLEVPPIILIAINYTSTSELTYYPV